MTLLYANVAKIDLKSQIFADVGNTYFFYVAQGIFECFVN
jgi:hypothetical protein